MVIGLNSDQLSVMRAQVNLMLPDTAVIKRVTNSSDGAGGFTASWAAVSGGTVLARIDPINSKNEITGDIGREALIVSHQLTLEYDAPILANDRVTINSNTYEVIQLSATHSNNVSIRAMVSMLK